MTVEMASRVAKVKEEVEDTKPEFLAHPLPHPHPAHSHAPQKLQEEGGLGQDPAPVRIKEEGGLVDNTCHGCGQTITDQWLLKVTTTCTLKIGISLGVSPSNSYHVVSAIYETEKCKC